MKEIIYLFICFIAFLFERNFINYKREGLICVLEEGSGEGSEGSDSEDLEDSEELEEFIEEEDCDSNKEKEIL